MSPQENCPAPRAPVAPAPSSGAAANAADWRFLFPLVHGLHARPASHVAAWARGQAATGRWHNERNGRVADLASPLGLVGTDTRAGDACRAEFFGGEPAAAAAAFARFIADVLPHCDDDLPVAPAEATPSDPRRRLPRLLRALAPAPLLAGTPAVAGLGRGRLLHLAGWTLSPALAAAAAADLATEQAQFRSALERVRRDLAVARDQQRGPAAAVLEAHLAFAHDPALEASVDAQLRHGQTAAQAVLRALSAQADLLRQSDNPYLQERVLDLEDLGSRLVAALVGTEAVPAVPRLAGPTVIAAERLTPGRLLALDRAHVQALLLSAAGDTSHTVILARSLGLPTLVGLGAAVRAWPEGAEVVVDAERGLAFLQPAEAVGAFYAREIAKAARRRQREAIGARRPGATADGRPLAVAANIATVPEGEAAWAAGADGIGLWRTELGLGDRPTAPSEDEQYEAFSAVVRAGAGRPVIVRLFDIGGDKPVPFLRLPAEKNPFLGERGVRLYRDHADLIRTQLRAILRAAVHGPLWVLVPMVSSAAEARVVRQMIAQARAELAAAGRPAGERVPFGLMLEVPAVAFALEELCAVADFFSVGTNDLAQYFFAADRENPRVQAFAAPLQPAFLRLLRQLVAGVRQRGRWIGLCGELAEQTVAWPLLAGLGLDEWSLAPPRLPAAKAALGTLDAGACAALLERACAAATTEEVAALLAAFAADSHAPSAGARALLVPALIDLDVACGSKEEVIRALADLVHEADRTAAPDALEEDLWRREETYATGFGDGFAVPHAKTAHITTPTIALLRCRQPVPWGAVDDAPVRVAILLALPLTAGAEHLRVFARLARLAVREEFRARLLAETEPTALAEFVLGQLTTTT